MPLHRRHPLAKILAGSALAVASAASSLLAPATAGATSSATYTYSSNYQSFTVPSGVTSLHVDVSGGSGGNGSGSYGGGGGAAGGEIIGDLPVTPGQVLTLWVGGAGQNNGGEGFGSPSHNDFEGGGGGDGAGPTTGNGGGGGAASYVKSGSTMLVLAGGGGGGGGGGIVGGGSGANGGAGAHQGLHYQYSWNGEADHGAYSSGANPGFADATGSDNGGGGGNAGASATFGGGGGGGGGGYAVCANSSQYSGCNVPFSAGGGGDGNNQVNGYGGAGGAGGDSFGAQQLTGVTFSSSGRVAGSAGQIVLTYGTASQTSVTSSANPSIAGQSVALHGFVTSDGGGTVSFTSDGTAISGCTNLPFASGGGTDWVANCTTSSLPSGTHTIAATYSGDSNYVGSSGTLSQTVYGSLSVTTSSLPNGTVGQSYSATLQASGGSGTDTWSITSGALPDGLSLSSSGSITGTPVHNQSPQFTVKATDSSTGQTATRQLSISVSGGGTAALIVQALRLSGPGGSGDDYVELYNPTSGAVNLTGWQLGYPGGVVNLPGASLPSGGHYLIAGSTYSLSSYEAADFTPAGLDIPSSGGVRLIAPNAQAVDAVGMTTADPAYREGTGLTAPTGTTVQLAFERRMSAGAPVTDATNNAADFVLVAPDANTADHGDGAILGAAAPQNLSYRIDANNIAPSYLLNPAQSSTGPDNRSYDAATGTLIVRRMITNTSSTQTIRGLWLRYTSITTYGAATASQAILVAQSAPGGETVDGHTMNATTLDDPPSQPNGGGLGSDVYIDVGDGGLAPGASIPVDLRFHVARGGSFSFGYNAEVYTGG